MSSTTVSALLFLALCRASQAIIRTHYIACVEEHWNYAPTGLNVFTGLPLEEDEYARRNMVTDTDRIGAKYKKALYREFTDDTFTVQKPVPGWLGALGPVLKGEVGDEIHVYFNNQCGRGYSMHPHGVMYTKDSEGAIYHDNTKGADKADDNVLPGETHLYEWIVDGHSAPQEDDPNCLTWAYHSHFDEPKDANAGLYGALLTCKPNTLDAEGNRLDVDHDFTLLLTMMDENQSWYLDENIETYCLVPESVNPDDENFIKSNNMYSINGYMYGNMPSLKTCAGMNISWHLIGMGTEVDFHPIYFHGENMNYAHHTTDTIGLFPATFATGLMTPHNPGLWMSKCANTHHYDYGMAVLFDIQDCGLADAPKLTGLTDAVREYYIQAEDVYWDYGPSGMNNFYGGPLNEPGSESGTFFERGDYRIGGVYKKTIFVEYTDATFNTRKDRTVDEYHMGYLGPPIRAEVGDQIHVTFRNMANRSHSIHPHGVFYDKANEGAGYQDGTEGADKLDDAVPPGGVYTYMWSVPTEWAPLAGDGPCLTYVYYSHVHPTKDIYSGLIGPLIVCNQGQGIGVDFNREVFLHFGVTDENQSWHIESNIQKFCGLPDDVDRQNEDFMESNLMHGINGYLYANIPSLAFCTSDTIMFHLMTMGDAVDIHGAHFHGNTLTWNSNHVDTIPLTPSILQHAIMQPKNIGDWAFVCRTNDHYRAGMMGLYSVNDCAKANSIESAKHVDAIPQAMTRTYYIAAVEEEWDYAPNGYDRITNSSLYNPNSYGYIFCYRGNTSIGHQYKKAVYKEYEDKDFLIEKPRTPEESHLHMLGPYIKAEIGDTVEVVFKNMASRSYSLHPHGLAYSKSSEGSPYMDGNVGGGDAVQPGEVYNYLWTVPASSGPSDYDSNCITWAYYSAVNPIKDTNSGLIGPLIVCRPGILDAEGTRNDVDREFALLFTVTDENESWYFDENIQTYCYTPGEVDKDDGDFQESNLMHGINGKIYGNAYGVEMYSGERIDWYLMAMGSEVDMHTVHVHGTTFLHEHGIGVHRADVYDLFPGTFKTVGMVPTNPGEWFLHCHVNDHIHAGMDLVYTVRETTQNAGLISNDLVVIDTESTANAAQPGLLLWSLAFIGLICKKI